METHALTSGAILTTFLVPEFILGALFNHHRILHSVTQRNHKKYYKYGRTVCCYNTSGSSVYGTTLLDKFKFVV